MLFRPGSLPDLPKLKTNKALLIIDLQNDFVSPTGKLHVPNTAEFVSKLPALIEKFREDGLVVWTQTSYRMPVSTKNAAIITQLPRRPSTPGHRALVDPSKAAEVPQNVTDASKLTPTRNAEAFLSASVPAGSRCCIPATTGAAVPDELLACMDNAKDMINVKSDYSALSNLTLMMQLRARMVTDLYICGSLSNIGVYASVFDAVQQGFNVKLIEDCLGYRDLSLHHQAMKRMADDLCAEGIDYQELMDDLYGLLGDVIPGTKYTQEYQVSLSAHGSLSSQAARGSPVSHTDKVTKWMDEMNQRPSKLEARSSKDMNRRHSSFLASEVKSDPSYDSSEAVQKSRISPRSSPARKRSTSDRDSVIEPLPPSISSGTIAADSPEQVRSDIPTSKKSKLEQAPEIDEDSEDHSLQKYTSPTQFLGQSLSTSQVPTRETPPTEIRSMSQPTLPTENRKPRQKKNKYTPTYLSSTDKLGDGDSRLVLDVLPPNEADSIFHKLKSDIAWQTMYHRTGAVPRLVAVQGTITSGAIPIYRHPADESPPLLPFDQTVTTLRTYCESIVSHPLNHVLIQHYRSGEDNISEHSDKTLDIVRGSSIVNLSLGAMRTMTLRTKKSNGHERESQRIQLPHNSVFVLGQRTNANWLHSIRVDKRPDCEKSEEEMAFGCERISLTFRHIGTFWDMEKGLIWGQGATGKTREEAKSVLEGEGAEEAKEAVVIGFGKENHCNEAEFDWDGIYGKGFDVVNYIVQENKT